MPKKIKFEHMAMKDDPVNSHQALKSVNSQRWLEDMNEEIQSMKDNDV